MKPIIADYIKQIKLNSPIALDDKMFLTFFTKLFP